MRLLDTATGEFRIVHDPHSVKYAIISHTWSKDGEQSYQDIIDIQKSVLEMASKVQEEHGHDPCEGCTDQKKDPSAVPRPSSPYIAHDDSAHTDAIVSADGAAPVPADDSKEGHSLKGVSEGMLWRVLSLLFHSFGLSYVMFDAVLPYLPMGSILFLRRAATYCMARIRITISAWIPECLGSLVALLWLRCSSVVGAASYSTGRSGANSPTSRPPEPQVVPVPALVRHVEERVGEDLSSQSSPSNVPDEHGHRISYLLDPRISEKVRMSCVVALMAGLPLVWLDSCCIDKASSAELSEAINSMYEWYEGATVCFVYLADVDDNEDVFSPDSTFRQSTWHYRGWTLQELVAPRHQVFLSRGWKIVGTKLGLAKVLTEVTGVPLAILNHEYSVDEVPVAQRMSWASQRVTTRVEDEAYSLMGIFCVHMPIIYGEGRNAFVRLQEEILRHTYDHSIFAWGPSWCYETAPEVPQATCSSEGKLEPRVPFYHLIGLLANSPNDFKSSWTFEFMSTTTLATRLRVDPSELSLPHYTISHDINTQLPIIPWSTELVNSLLPESYRGLVFDHLAFLGCEGVNDTIVCLPLYRIRFKDREPYDPRAKYTYLVGAMLEKDPCVYYHTFQLTQGQLEEHLSTLHLEDLRISRRPPNRRFDGMSLFDHARSNRSQVHLTRSTALWCVRVDTWCQRVLSQQGFLIRNYERRDISSSEFLLFRAGDEQFEVIRISAVFIRFKASSSKHYTGFERFRVLYKTARPYDANGDRLCNSVPELEQQECTEVSCDINTPHTRWSMFRLRDHARGTSRMLRLSLTWDRYLFAYVTIEITDPYEDSAQDDDAPISPLDEDALWIPQDNMKTQSAERKYNELLDYLLPMWMYFVVDKCSTEIEDVYTRSVALSALIQREIEQEHVPDTLFGGKYLHWTRPSLQYTPRRNRDHYDLGWKS